MKVLVCDVSKTTFTCSHRYGGDWKIGEELTVEKAESSSCRAKDGRGGATQTPLSCGCWRQPKKRLAGGGRLGTKGVGWAVALLMWNAEFNTRLCSIQLAEVDPSGSPTGTFFFFFFPMLFQSFRSDVTWGYRYP